MYRYSGTVQPVAGRFIRHLIRLWVTSWFQWRLPQRRLSHVCHVIHIPGRITGPLTPASLERPSQVGVQGTTTRVHYANPSVRLIPPVGGTFPRCQCTARGSGILKGFGVEWLLFGKYYWRGNPGGAWGTMNGPSRLLSIHPCRSACWLIFSDLPSWRSYFLVLMLHQMFYNSYGYTTSACNPWI